MTGHKVSLRPRRSAPAHIVREGKRAVWDAPGESATLEEIERNLTRGRNYTFNTGHFQQIAPPEFIGRIVSP